MKDITHPFLRTYRRSALYWTALLTAIIFVAHPIQTGAVTYTVQRFASLTTLFYLLALVLYIKARLLKKQGKSGIWHLASGIYLLSLLSTILAMKTKEISFTLPFIIALYEFTFFATCSQQSVNINKKKVLYLLPFLLTLLIIPLSKIEAVEGVDPLGGTTVPFSRWEYLFTQFRVVVTYIRLMFLPINQNLDYDYPIYHSFFEPGVFLSFFFLLSIFAIALYCCCSRSTVNGQRLISFGLLWFFITLSIESSIIPLREIIFEHRLYLPSVGLIIAFVSSLSYGFVWLGRRGKTYTIISCFLLLAFIFTVSLSIAAYQRNIVWGNAYTLWRDTVNKSPNKARPHYNFGLAHDKKGLIDEAIEEYKKALSIKPDYFEAHNNLGIAYAKKGLLNEAIEEYQRALRSNPLYHDALYNLAFALEKIGNKNGAANYYKSFIEVAPPSLKPFIDKAKKRILQLEDTFLETP